MGPSCGNGAAPKNTGWYGRGKAGVSTKINENNEKYLKRPAIKQAEATGGASTAYREGADEFNIWYGRYQQNYSGRGDRTPAATRCKVALHAGYTLGDKLKPDDGYFCMWWARGACTKGEKCGYYHRIPTAAECGRLEGDSMHDCFGRDRFATQREDNGGVGSFNDNSRTLYVGGLQRTPYEGNPKKLQKAVDDAFSEFGEVENVNIIWRLSIAFVRYRYRSYAELAKEAMKHQSLGNNEILNVRWGNEDPNPIAKEAAKRANADAVVAAVTAAGHGYAALEDRPAKRLKS